MCQTLGLITARGGSKGIPNKNITLLAGKPLIAWTIEAALQSSLDRVIVSTEDEKIAEIAARWGAEVPFKRPAYLAQDTSPHIDVIVHNIQWLYDHEGSVPDWLMLLQPTSPLRTSKDIDNALHICLTGDAESVLSVTQSEIHPYLCKTIDEQGRLHHFLTPPEGYLQRQVLPPVFRLNGAIYLARTDYVYQQKSWYTANTRAFVMPPERSIDVDTEWDLLLTEFVLKYGSGD